MIFLAYKSLVYFLFIITKSAKLEHFFWKNDVIKNVVSTSLAENPRKSAQVIFILNVHEAVTFEWMYGNEQGLLWFDRCFNKFAQYGQ